VDVISFKNSPDSVIIRSNAKDQAYNPILWYFNSVTRSHGKPYTYDHVIAKEISLCNEHFECGYS
jgi:hypothetical protein